MVIYNIEAKTKRLEKIALFADISTAPYSVMPEVPPMIIPDKKVVVEKGVANPTPASSPTSGAPKWLLPAALTVGAIGVGAGVGGLSKFMKNKNMLKAHSNEIKNIGRLAEKGRALNQVPLAMRNQYLGLRGAAPAAGGKMSKDQIKNLLATVGAYEGGQLVLGSKRK